MLEQVAIAVAFAVGVFSENVFGFGGTIVAMGLLSFMVEPGNIKDLVFVIFLVTNFSAIAIALTSWQQIAWRRLWPMLPVSFFGLVLGAHFLHTCTPLLVLRFFAIFIVVSGCLSLLPRLQSWRPGIWLRHILIFCSGVVTGLFGGGGVFAVLAMRNLLDGKSHFRATMMAFFVFCNVVRGVQYFVQGTFDFGRTAEFWWIFPPIALAFLLGRKVHVRISEQNFRRGVSLFILLAGVFMLAKSFS